MLREWISVLFWIYQDSNGDILYDACISSVDTRNGLSSAMVAGLE